MSILIKTCTPSPEHREWGDTPFAERLAAAFGELGHRAIVQTVRDWDITPPDTRLVIALVGLSRYEPRPGPVSLAWIISHPELRTPAELNRFDRVLVASESFAERIRGDLVVPVAVLPQCTDPDLFAPEPADEDIDLLFVGNNYYREHPLRLLIADVLAAGYGDRLRVVGRGWEKGLPRERILAEFMPYEGLPALYRRAKINLNDHHRLMRDNGFINNRAYDLAALGKFQISDPVPGLDRLGIASYPDVAGLREKLGYYLDYPAERERSATVTRRLCAGATFLARARTLLEAGGIG